MADPEKFGDWLNPAQDSLGVNLPKLPAFVNETVTFVNGLVDFLLGVLDVALAALEVVKAFVPGLLDPVSAIVEAILAELQNLLEDLRTAGLYLSGDWGLVSAPFSDIRGGFSAYERRMIARFVDRTDPTRPDIGPTTEVLGMFLYLSTGSVEGVDKLSRFITLLTKFFNFDFQATKTTQTPSDLRVEYGTENSSFAFALRAAESFDRATQPPDVANVSWTLSSPVLKTPDISFPIPPPHGFLVQVSVVRDGLPVFFDRPLADSIRVEGPSGALTQDRESGRVLTPEGIPLVVYGGGGVLSLSESLQYNNTMANAGLVKNGAARVFFKKTASDNVPIPPDQLILGDGRHLLQKTFFVPTDDLFAAGTLSFGFLQRARYDAALPFSEMPYDAEFEIQGDGTISVVEDSIVRPQNFFVRVAVVSSAINSAEPAFYTLGTTDVDAPAEFPRVRYGRFVDPDNRDLGEQQFSRGDLGDASAPLEVNFPSEDTKSFMDLITRALIVTVLSRSDLSVGGTEEDFVVGKARTETGLEEFGSLVAEVVKSANPSEFFSLADQTSETDDVTNFRQTLLDNARNVASRLYDRLGSVPGLEAAAIGVGQPLIDFRWSDTVRPTGEAVVDGVSDISGARPLTAPEIAEFAANGGFNNFTEEQFQAFEQNQGSASLNLYESQLGFSVRFLSPNTFASAGEVSFITSPEDVQGFAASLFESYLFNLQDGFDVFDVSDLVDPSDQPDIEAAANAANANDDLAGSPIDTDVLDLGLISSLEDPEVDLGVARNPMAAGKGLETAGVPLNFGDRGSVNVASRTPGFYERQVGGLRCGSVDDSPVLVVQREDGDFTMFYCRNLFPDDVYNAARLVLNAAAAPTLRPNNDGAWINYRLAQALPSLDLAVDTVSSWVGSIGVGNSGITEAISEYIDFLESRVLELQGLLTRIDAIVDNIVVIQLPSFASLFVLGQGTEGVLSQFLAAGNKPSEPQTTYGAGAVALLSSSPFIPSFLVDLILTLFTEDT